MNVEHELETMSYDNSDNRGNWHCSCGVSRHPRVYEVNAVLYDFLNHANAEYFNEKLRPQST